MTVTESFLKDPNDVAGPWAMLDWLNEQNSDRPWRDYLDLHPDDHAMRLHFAQWFESRYDPRSGGYRALAQLRVSTMSGGGGECGSGYCFVGTLENEYHNQPGSDYFETLLPHDWFRLIPIVHEYDWTKYWRYGATRKEIEDRVATAFLGLPLRRQMELMNPRS